ncbi:MAG TPA: RnfABCDGE type electron transport complex subunit G [Acidobacteriota bacterium]|nr:RnfABCDGE type electron transport complex subunit G [Acidobacteriota bacterium]
MKELISLVVTLTVIAAVAGLALALVYSVTEEPIAEAEREQTLKAIRNVLPEFDDNLLQSVMFGEEKQKEIFIARANGGDLVGVAFSSISRNGYGGNLEVMVGLVPEGEGYKVNRIEILRHAETPGLGTKIAEEKFKGQFNSVNYDNLTFAVDKDDPGSTDKPSIDSITGATISSRAVTEAVQMALDFFLENVDTIFKAAEQAEGSR